MMEPKIRGTECLECPLFEAAEVGGDDLDLGKWAYLVCFFLGIFIGFMIVTGLVNLPDGAKIWQRVSSVEEVPSSH